MVLIESTTHNPFFNIATEEIILKNCDYDIIYLYRNKPSVIIGKHQIHNLEVNIPFITENNIPVIRRISGGGSVFHDLNNINYCVISTKERAWVDFKSFTEPLIYYLKNIGLNPVLRARSDIAIDGRKISGNASHIFKKRVLHHGSILLSTDIDMLTETLRNVPNRYEANNVRSRRSLVTNIANHLNQDISTDDFQKQFIEMLWERKIIREQRSLANSEIKQIERLVKNKYKTNIWNVSYNANYRFCNSFFYQGKIYQVEILSKRGIANFILREASNLSDYQMVGENVPHETSVFVNLLIKKFPKDIILENFF